MGKEALVDYDSILGETEKAFQKALEHLKREYRGIRTGRASPGLVENISFDYYGSQQPIKNAATISVQDATTLTIKPFDASQIASISKAIQAANLGLNPVEDGHMLRISLPPMTEENRKKIAGQLKNFAESTKVSIRNARQDGNKKADQSLKDKTPGMTEDQHRELKEEIQSLTNKYNKKVEQALEEKTEDVMKI